MMHVRETLLLIIIAAWFTLIGAGDHSGKSRGDSMYVWSTAVHMVDGKVNNGISDNQAQQRLLRFCQAPAVDIRRLYLLVDPDMWNERSLLAFLHAAGKRSIDVYAVPRSVMQNRWIEPVRSTGRCDHTSILAWVDEILMFEQRHEGAGFAGIQLDIEPHAAGRRRPVWQNDRGGLRRSDLNRTISRQYLDLLGRIRDKMERSRLKLAATIPPWMDRDDRTESYLLRYKGANKVLAYHIMDRVDFVTLMNYFNGSSPANRAKAWKRVEGEIRYGPTEVLLQTARPERGRHAPSRRTTLYRGGEGLYRQIRNSLEKRYADNSNYIGCGAHHYLEAYGSGRRGWPSHM